MVVDSSALLAIFLIEPEAEAFAHAISNAPDVLISAASMLETGIVLDGRIAADATADLDTFIAGTGLSVEPVTAEQARLARVAYRTYGRGNHRANLNFGDCFAYALAKATDRPLLFKGNDFAHTDIIPAITTL